MGKGIDTINQLIIENKFDNSIVVYLLTLIRKEIEVLIVSDKESFDVLKFYCDWALHTVIDRSKSGSSIIANINRTIVIYQYVSGTDELIRAISILLTQKFKSQLLKFLNNCLIQTNIISDQKKWKQFYTTLLSVLEDTPVRLNAIDKKYLMDNPIKKRMWVCEIKIIKQTFNTPLSSTYEPIYALDLLTSDTTRIIIPLTYV